MVIEWLRVKYKVWVSVDPCDKSNYIYTIYCIGPHDEGFMDNEFVESENPYKAYSKALDWIKNNIEF
jgi:hypothetical protein